MIVAVTSELVVYQVDGADSDYGTDIKVHSHPTNTDLVVLRVDGKTYSVSARDLKFAIQNATNVGV